MLTIQRTILSKELPEGACILNPTNLDLWEAGLVGQRDVMPGSLQDGELDRLIHACSLPKTEAFAQGEARPEPGPQKEGCLAEDIISLRGVEQPSDSVRCGDT